MDTALVEWLGLLAGCLTTLSFLPQVWLVWRKKTASDISLGMYLLMCSGVALWLTYGVLIHSRPVVLANGLTLLLSMAVLLMKLVFDARSRTLANGPGG
jgi:MtN3 and saliva related transmembrane protein